jgi:hypothetical protein
LVTIGTSGSNFRRGVNRKEGNMGRCVYCDELTPGNDHTCPGCEEYWRTHCACCSEDLDAETSERTGGFCPSCYEKVEANRLQSEQERPERERREKEALLSLSRASGICPECYVTYDAFYMKQRSVGGYSTCHVCGARMVTKRQIDGAKAVIRKHLDVGLNPVILAVMIEDFGGYVIRGEVRYRRRPVATD